MLGLRLKSLGSGPRVEALASNPKAGPNRPMMTSVYKV